MKNICLLFILLLVACESTPKNPEAWIEREINSCLPTAIIFKQALNKYGVWSEVFTYRWKDSETGKSRGHAMVAYLYPPGKNQLWSYDEMGSYRVRALTNDIRNIAQYSHVTRGGSEIVYGAEWIK